MKNNPKMKQSESGSEEQGTQIRGEVTVDNKTVHVIIHDAPTNLEARFRCYEATDLFLIFFSVIDPDSLRNSIKKVRIKLVFPLHSTC